MNATRIALYLGGILLASCSLSSDPDLATPATQCSPGTKLCGAACVALDDPEHGCSSASCEPCPSADNLGAICAAGLCAFGPCDVGWGDCDSAPDNGCETDLTSSVEHCGSCSTTCLGANTVAADTSCTSGQCQLSCADGFGDCDLDAASGCEAEHAVSGSHCGGCNHPCEADELCQQGSCVADDPTLAWLATQQGGWCLDDHLKLINLCGKISHCSYTLCGDLDDEAPESGDPATSSNCYPDLDHEHDRAVPFCCDPAYFRTYPDGIALDVGLHYDGLSIGHVLSLGGDHAGNSIGLTFDEPGVLSAGMLASDRVTTPLSEGTHLLSLRLTTSQIALHIDGVLVATGAGSPDPKELQAAYGPGFVVGSRMSYWWEALPATRFAPFLVHLRDSVDDPTVFALSDVTEPGASTVVLFDGEGAANNAWNATSGAGIGYAISKELGGADGAWVADAWASCL